MSDFKPITTQEELDSIIVKRLERENKKVTKEMTEKFTKELEDAKQIKGQFAELQQKLDKVTKEAELYAKTQEQLAEMTNRVRAYETEHIKTQVALKNGLDISAVDFIKGETTEEIQASAEQLKSLVDKNSTQLPMRESKPADSTEQAIRDLANSLFK